MQICHHKLCLGTLIKIFVILKLCKESNLFCISLKLTISYYQYIYICLLIFLCNRCCSLVGAWPPLHPTCSQFLYSRFIRPFILKYEKKIDETLDQVGDVAASTLNEGKVSKDTEWFKKICIYKYTYADVIYNHLFLCPLYSLSLLVLVVMSILISKGPVRAVCTYRFDTGVWIGLHYFPIKRLMQRELTSLPTKCWTDNKTVKTVIIMNVQYLSLACVL